MPAITGKSLRAPHVCKTVTGTHVTFRIDDPITGVEVEVRLTRTELLNLTDEIDILLSGAPTTELALGIADLED